MKKIMIPFILCIIMVYCNFSCIYYEKTYPIPSVGPAGGDVFYDKGYYSNGWRYLEAAPENIESTKIFSSNYSLIGSTKKDIGSGKENTRIIIEFLKSKNEKDCAAQYCNNLNFGGYNDWFLPSIGELKRMQEILFPNIGAYDPSHTYWSSSEDPDNGEYSQGIIMAWKDSIIYYYKDSETKVKAIRSF